MIRKSEYWPVKPTSAFFIRLATMANDIALSSERLACNKSAALAKEATTCLGSLHCSQLAVIYTSLWKNGTFLVNFYRLCFDRQQRCQTKMHLMHFPHRLSDFNYLKQKSLPSFSNQARCQQSAIFMCTISVKVMLSYCHTVKRISVIHLIRYIM